MDERLTLGDRLLLRRLDDYFAAEIERAQRDFEATVDAAPQTRLRIRQSSHSSLPFGGLLALFVTVVLAVAHSSGAINAPLPSGTSPMPGLAGLDIKAFGRSAVVVATADGAAIVRPDGDVVELLVAVQTGDAWAVSVVDRTLRIPSQYETAGQDTNGWYLAGNAVVCDAASGLRDRGFIYGWLAAGPSSDRVELSGIPVRGDGRLVNGLYLFVTNGTPVTGASYVLMPFDGPSARQSIHLQGKFGIPAPVACSVPQDAGSPEGTASIEGPIPAPSGSVLPRRQGDP